MGLGEHGRPEDWDDSTAVALIGVLGSEGAAELRHEGGRTLLDHLLGTYTIMRRWEQPVWLAHAALIHSVYGTEAYDPQLVSSARRDAIAAVAGARAERLAHLFCVTPRRPLFAGTHLWARDLPTRSTGGPSTANDGAPATRDELDALLILHMANIAEQARAADGSPGRWLARCDALTELLADSDTVTAPRFAARLAAFGEADERLVRRAYLYGLSEKGEARTSALALAAAVCPVVPEPCVWLAHLSRCRGDATATTSWTAQARKRLSELGTSWDKRLTFEEWLALIEALDRPAEADPSRGSRAATDPRALFEALVPHGTAARSQAVGRPAIAAADAAAGRKRFQRYIEGLADAGGPSSGAIYPDLPSRPWHEPGDFPLVGYLESNFEEIRDEILALEAGRFHRESERIGRTGDWDVAFLYERGRRHDDTCAACPVTARGIETHPTIRTVAGLIYVSRLRAETHISAHRGPTNLRVRCHLAVRVPEGDCAIRVGEQTRRWQEGKCLVFDDYFDHEAWNHTEEDRIVLIVDLWHPGLTSTEVRLLEALHGYTYFHARRLSRYWSANARAARRSGQSAAPES
jgi:aspartate beta-hydroxylase